MNINVIYVNGLPDFYKNKNCLPHVAMSSCQRLVKWSVKNFLFIMGSFCLRRIIKDDR